MPIDHSNPGLDRPTLQHSRREFLRRGSRGFLGAAACGISALTGGCVPRAAKRVPIRVGILHSQTGTMAISETSLRDIELFAIEEINAAGGILGRRIEAIVEDPKSRFSDLFPRRA